MTVRAEVSRPESKFKGIERVGVERHFWPNVIDILQTHETKRLRARVLKVATRAPNVDLDEVKKSMTVIDTAYAGKTRKFTGNNEENHSLQVFLIGAEIMGLDNVTTRKAQIMLGHNLIEDTSMPDSFKDGMQTEHVYSGIRVLSHTEDGIPLYNKEDRTEHFIDIINAHGEEEHVPSELLAIKLADFIAVGNDPVTSDELIDPGLIQKWERLTNKKIGEMEKFLELLPPGHLGIRRRLRETIAFTKLRQNPEALATLNEMFEIRKVRERQAQEEDVQ